MSPELNRRLCESYPEILGRLRLDCGDGWYTLIDTACFLSMQVMEENHLVALQVKEKFGGLSMLIHGGDVRTRAFVEFAEVMSENICELCGRPGVLLGNHDGGWLRTRCGACDAAEGDSYLPDAP